MIKGIFITKKWLKKTKRKLDYFQAIDEVRRITKQHSNLTILQLCQSMEFFEDTLHKDQRITYE